MTRDGRLTEEGWQQLQRLVDALRELQAASADHETRIADLEP
jgi:DNA-binding PadR family transcriptional regulator